MVGLLLLQYMQNLSDEAVVRAWVENPYWQYFCGYDFIQWDLPIDSQMAHHLCTRSKTDKKKIYSLHEPHVDCISKGKAPKKYEFGSKVALSITHQKNRGIITSCQSIAGNPFDGHTLLSSLQMSERITQTKVKEAYVDRGYKGHGVENGQVYISGQRRGTTKKIRKDIKRRQAIEPHIGHLKQKVKLGLCRLKGIIGDQVNALLSAAAYNLRQIVRHIRIIFAQILWMIYNYGSIKNKNHLIYCTTK